MSCLICYSPLDHQQTNHHHKSRDKETTADDKGYNDVVTKRAKEKKTFRDNLLKVCTCYP